MHDRLCEHHFAIYIYEELANKPCKHPVSLTGNCIKEECPLYERWANIKYNGVEYPYQISDFGRVLNRKGKRICIFMRGTRKGKYPAVALYKNGRRKNVDVHRLVALHFIPNPERKPEVNHKDVNVMNCWHGNLEWMTRAENEAHKRFMEAHLDL